LKSRLEQRKDEGGHVGALLTISHRRFFGLLGSLRRAFGDVRRHLKGAGSRADCGAEQIDGVRALGGQDEPDRAFVASGVGQLVHDADMMVMPLVWSMINRSISWGTHRKCTGRDMPQHVVTP
jgi:hypothetical protein